MRRDAAAIGHLLETTFKVFLLANMFSLRNISELHRVPSPAADQNCCSLMLLIGVPHLKQALCLGDYIQG